MTAPKEPGYPRPGDGPGSGRITETGEPPPWQRGQPRPHPAPPRSAEPPRSPEPLHRPPAPKPRQEPKPTGHSPGVDARLRQFVSGTAAPDAQSGQAKPPAQQAPGDGQPADAYGSELPDLSGSRPVERKLTGQRVQVSPGPRGPLRASMQIRRIDPWSMLKVSALLSGALFFVWMLAVAFLYLLLGGMGVWSRLNSNVGDLLNDNSAAELVSSGSIFGTAALIGLVNIVVLTAMATLGAVIYNLSTDVVGGVEVTLADRD